MAWPSSAAARIAFASGCRPAASAANTASESFSVSTASNSGSLSSWLSLLYASGWPFISVSSATRWPKTRPLLPRTSSGTSGFFFCGMIELPVQKRSGILTKPKRGLIQSTSSSAKRDRCTIARAAQAANSMAKSRSETASSEFSATPSKPSSRATRSRSMGKVVPASAAAPSGSTLTRLRQSASRARSRSSISA